MAQKVPFSDRWRRLHNDLRRRWRGRRPRRQHRHCLGELRHVRDQLLQLLVALGGANAGTNGAGERDRRPCHRHIVCLSFPT